MQNILYTIMYEYLDKRGYRRSKKILCCGIERLKEHCIDISKLTEHKPIGPPTIYKTDFQTNTYRGTVNYKAILKGDYDE
jgi:hypothetical protein